MLKGEEFKKYVSELRGKSALYKSKKAELSALSTEYGVLQRTEEVFLSIYCIQNWELKQWDNNSY